MKLTTRGYYVLAMTCGVVFIMVNWLESYGQ